MNMTKQEILDCTMWVVKHTWGRAVITGEALAEMVCTPDDEWWDDIKDIDLCAKQPNEEIQALVDEYEGLRVSMTWPEFIDSLVKEGC